MKRYALEIVLGIVEFSLAAMAFVEQLPASKALLPQIIGDPTRAVFAYLTLMIATLACYIALKLNLETAKVGDAVRKLEALVDHAAKGTARALKESDFYSEMAAALRRARDVVYLAHLGVDPPVYERGTAGAIYYDEFFSLVKRKRDVRFRRVERFSRKKIEWLTRCVKELQGRDNFSLFLMKSDESHGLTGYMSVQLVDDHTTFLVAICAHTGPQNFRDVVIEDKETNRLFDTYYEAVLLKRSTAILENGRLNEAAWEAYLK